MISRRWIVVLLLGAIGVGLWYGGSVGQAQQKAQDESGGQAERPAPRNRLPMFYSRVVTPEQREQIYAIQRKYQQQIDELTAQLRAVEVQRDEEIRAVLTPEQQKQIDAWMKELQERRAAARARANSDAAAEDQEHEAEATPPPPPQPTRSSRSSSRSSRSSGNP